MNDSPSTQPTGKAAILLAELETAMARESFWLARWEMAPLLESLPAKNDLIEAVRETPLPADDEGQMLRQARELAARQEEHVRRLERRLVELRRELEAITQASHRLQQWEEAAEGSSSEPPAHWA